MYWVEPKPSQGHTLFDNGYLVVDADFTFMWGEKAGYIKGGHVYIRDGDWREVFHFKKDVVSRGEGHTPDWIIIDQNSNFTALSTSGEKIQLPQMEMVYCREGLYYGFRWVDDCYYSVKYDPIARREDAIKTDKVSLCGFERPMDAWKYPSQGVGFASMLADWDGLWFVGALALSFFAR